MRIEVGAGASTRHDKGNDRSWLEPRPESVSDWVGRVATSPGARGRHILLLKYRQIPASEDLVFVGREERYDAMLLPRVEPATLRPQPVGHGLLVPGGRSGEHSLLAADRAPQVAR